MSAYSVLPIIASMASRTFLRGWPPRPQSSRACSSHCSLSPECYQLRVRRDDTYRRVIASSTMVRPHQSSRKNIRSVIARSEATKQSPATDNGRLLPFDRLRTSGKPQHKPLIAMTVDDFLHNASLADALERITHNRRITATACRHDTVCRFRPQND